MKRSALVWRDGTQMQVDIELCGALNLSMKDACAMAIWSAAAPGMIITFT